MECRPSQSQILKTQFLQPSFRSNFSLLFKMQYFSFSLRRQHFFSLNIFNSFCTYLENLEGMKNNSFGTHNNWVIGFFKRIKLTLSILNNAKCSIKGQKRASSNFLSFPCNLCFHPKMDKKFQLPNILYLKKVSFRFLKPDLELLERCCNYLRKSRG